ncbi:hypothetical protein MYX64_06025 [Nitrospinae bacterium AH_259_B05_G02_I21]|nr:hypothetical protein [Nitrospinae bacterium AH_259_B05_G02_I21]MDA2931792.1 hypothetical protein [Nitrospinae bacterium AH-259-F20]
MTTLKQHRQATKKAKKAERKTGKKVRDNKVAIIRRPMWQSKAWRSVSSKAHDVYIHALMEYNPTKFDGEIFCLPNSQLTYIATKNTITRAIGELVERGFLDIVEYGGLFNRPSKYTLSERWETWEPTDEK